MKKLFLIMSAAALVFAGCGKEPKVDPPAPTADAISLDIKSKTFDSTGGEVDVKVTSAGESDEWALTGDFDWATPSARTGKNGDAVKFTVDANDTFEDKIAEFTFTRGEKTAEFTITVTGKNEPEIEFSLVDPTQSDITLSNAKGNFEVKIKTDVPYRELVETVNILTGDAGWLTYGTTADNGDGTISVKFDYTANASTEGRTAEIVLATDETEDPEGEIVINVTQSPTPSIVLDETNFQVAVEGESFNIKVTANVEYEVTIDSDWITKGSVTNGTHTFTAAAFTDGTIRTGKITFKQTGGELSAVATVIQKQEGLVNFAAHFKGLGGTSANRAWPTWNEPAELMGMTSITYETLVNANWFTKEADMSQWSQYRLHTIMGREGKLLMRVGDAGSGDTNLDELQICWNQKVGSTDGEGKLTFDGVPNEQWVHIAVTYDVANKTVKAYFDGVLKKTVTAPATTTLYPVDLGVVHNPNDGPSAVNHSFFVGWAYQDGRYLDGMVAEMRIWNKVLTEEEINADGHFYSVDPNSEGLVAYWKFNDGAGNTVKDYSKLGNDLTAKDDLDWREVTFE